MAITLTKQAAKAIMSFDQPTQQRIIAGILELPKGDITILEGYTDGRARLRIGKYRIIFKDTGENIEIMDIGSRGDIYK